MDPEPKADKGKQVQDGRKYKIRKTRRDNVGFFCYPAAMIRKTMVLLIVTGLTLLGYMCSIAKQDPVIREAEVMMTDWPANQPSLKMMLVSDIHVAGPDMSPERLQRIVNQINGANPDIVAFAGDFVSDKRTATTLYTVDQALAPLGNLAPGMGSFAVLGNHDHWRNVKAVTDGLADVGITLLSNRATEIGPIALGGIDDDFTNHSNVPVVLAQMSTLQGVPIYLSHSPDITPDIPNKESIILAGHTHCGQIVIPLIGALAYMSKYGDRYACGQIEEDGKTIFVSAGLGTSLLPLRLGAVPDMWMITVGPKPKP
jgi:predicted MPP superfamily phosphohydrolase